MVWVVVDGGWSELIRKAHIRIELDAQIVDVFTGGLWKLES